MILGYLGLGDDDDGFNEKKDFRGVRGLVGWEGMGWKFLRWDVTERGYDFLSGVGGRGEVLDFLSEM